MTEKEKKKGTYYVKPADFTKEINEFYEASKLVEDFEGDKDTPEYRKLLHREKKAVDKCGLSIYKMTVGLSNHPKFSGYTWKDEMISDALIKCNRALVGKKFDPNRGFNPFSYFNMIAAREFVHRIKVEKGHFAAVNKFGEEFLRGFAKDCDDPIYIKPTFVSKLGEFYNDDMEIFNENAE